MRLSLPLLPLLLLSNFAAPHAGAMTPQERSTAVRDLQQGRVDDVLRLAQAAPEDAEAQQLVCRAQYELEAWEEAIAACKKAVALDGSTSANHLWLGRALGGKADRASFVKAYGLAKQVRTEFEAAASLDPHSAEALADLGEYYAEAPGIVGGGADKAEAVAARLDALDHTRAEELRAQIATHAKDMDAAKQHLHNAIAASSKPASLWMALASVSRRQGDLDQMTDALQHGIAADRSRGPALVDAAHLLTRADRDPELAIRLLQEYLASPAKSEDEPAFRVQLFLAALLTKQGDSAGAAQQIQAASAIASGYHPSKPAETNTGR